MPGHKVLAHRAHKRPTKRRLLDGVCPIVPKQRIVRASVTTPVMIDLVTDSSQSQSTNDLITSSSSMLKQHEDEVKKVDQKKSSPDPTLSRRQEQQQQRRQQQQQHQKHEQQLLNIVPMLQQQQQQQPLYVANSPYFYSPMYRRYFGLTPPNPRLCNPRLLEDYIDWYINVYLEEELPWHSMNIGNVAERISQSEEEAKKEAEELTAAASCFKASKM